MSTEAGKETHHIMTTHSPEGPSSHQTGTERHPVERALNDPAQLPPEEHQYDRIVEENNRLKAKAKRMRLIGGGTVAGLLLVGGGVLAGSKLGGEDSPEPTQPAAEAPANPGEVEAPVDNTAPEPIDTPPESDPVVSPEAEGPSNPEDITRLGEVTEDGEPVFTNEQIREWFRIDTGDIMGAQTFLPAYMTEHGADDNYVLNAEAWLDSYNEVTYGYNTGYFNEEGDDIEDYFEDLDRKLLTGMNMVIASPELYDGSTDPHFGSMALRGTLGQMIKEIATEGLDCETDCTVSMDDALINGLVNEMQSLPEGAVVTDANIWNIERHEGQNPGTELRYILRTPDGISTEVVYELTDRTPELAPLESAYEGRTVDVTPMTPYEPAQAGPDARAYFPHVPVE